MNAPLPALSDEDVVKEARELLTGATLVADIEDPAWVTSLALIFAAWKEGPPLNVGAIVVPVGPHLGGYWVNGRAPAVTLECRLISTESWPVVIAKFKEFRAVLYPEEDE